MRKVIGIVGEGPIDQMVLKAAINRMTGESHIYNWDSITGHCGSARKLETDIRQWAMKS